MVGNWAGHSVVEHLSREDARDLGFNPQYPHPFTLDRNIKCSTIRAKNLTATKIKQLQLFWSWTSQWFF